MKKLLVSSFLLGGILIACAEKQPVPAIPSDPEIEGKIEKLLKNLTLEEKIGQMCELTIGVIKMSMSANGHWLVSYSSSTFTEPGFFITQNLSRGSTLWTKFLLSGKMLPVSTAKCCYVRKRRRLIRR